MAPVQSRPLKLENVPRGPRPKARNPDPRGLQHPKHAIITGRTGSGKSELVAAMITNPVLCQTYDRVLIVCPQHTEVWNEALLPFVGNDQDVVRFYDSIEALPPEASFDRHEQTLVILDDILILARRGKMKDQVEDMFIRYRHLNVSIWLLVQGFHEVSPLVRGQCRYYIFFRGIGRRKLSDIYSAICSDLPNSELFIAAYNEAVSNEDWFERFLLVDTEAPNLLLRYRGGLNHTLDVIEEADEN